eukprot:9275730-Pyramimonas_sp.AAC.1
MLGSAWGWGEGGCALDGAVVAAARVEQPKGVGAAIRVQHRPAHACTHGSAGEVRVRSFDSTKRSRLCATSDTTLLAQSVRVRLKYAGACGNRSTSRVSRGRVEEMCVLTPTLGPHPPSPAEGTTPSRVREVGGAR